MAVLIKADGTVTEIRPRNKKFFTLEEMQELVGGYIEVLGRLDHDAVIRDTEKPIKVEVKLGDKLVIDEEGKLKKKPLNKIACFIYEYGLKDGIVGDALLCREGELR